MNKMMRVRALLVSAVMVVGLGVVAAPSASAADCAADETPALTLQSASGSVRDNLYLDFIAKVSVSCGSVAPITGGPFVFAKNETTGYDDLATYLNKENATGASADLKGTITLPYEAQYGKFSIPLLRVYYGKTLATSGDFYQDFTFPAAAFYSRAKPYLEDPYPATQTVLAGQSVILSGYFYSYAGYAGELKKPARVELQLQNASGGWDTEQTTSVSDTNTFRFTYVPSKSVTYRYHYTQTDWALEKASLQAIINYIPETVVNKPPAMPPAYISGTTSSTISLDWDKPSPTNGTITAYRFGWATPSGKPVPAWEGTYPTTKTVPDPFVFTNLVPDTDYTVWIEAVNGTTAENISARNTFTVRTAKAVTPPPACDPAYPDFCIPPPPPDKDCTDFTQKNFKALAPDPHGLDEDGDGIACEAAVTPPPPVVTPPPPVVTPPVVTPPAPAAPPAVVAPPAGNAATVYVAAVSKKGKLYVDVNPNKGKGYWKFQVQRLKGDVWKHYKTYKTSGSKETRTLNLKKGTYRVVVLPKYGLLGAVSDGVYLRK